MYVIIVLYPKCGTIISVIGPFDTRTEALEYGDKHVWVGNYQSVGHLRDDGWGTKRHAIIERLSKRAV